MRRRFTRALLAALGAIALAACGADRPQPLSHLVVICLDTVRYDTFLERDEKDALTPWLERAQIYTDASSSAPWTMPGVSSLFTGLYAVEHGAGRFESRVANLDVEVPSALPDEARTLAEVLDENYFRTGAFVSHPFFIAELGLQQGFQVVHNRRGWHRDLARMWQWVERIDAPARFFGYLHFMEAHHRHTRDDATLDEYLSEIEPEHLARLRERWPANCEDPDSRRCRQSLVYEGAVLELRKGVAQVLYDLESRGYLDDTLVLLYSDHGEEFWDHERIQLTQDRDPRGHPGLGHGQSLYQELLQVPLIVWHPRLEGARHEAPVSLVDALPSVLAWLGIETPDARYSGELLPPLGAPTSDRVIHASGIAYGPEQVANRRAAIKSIFALGTDEFEIYDLASDPGETRPLRSDTLLLEHETLAGDYLERPAIARSDAGSLDADQIDDLKAIGYLQGVEESDAGRLNGRAAGSDGNGGESGD